MIFVIRNFTLICKFSSIYKKCLRPEIVELFFKMWDTIDLYTKSQLSVEILTCRFHLALESPNGVRLERRSTKFISSVQFWKQSALFAAMKFTSFWKAGFTSN